MTIARRLLGLLLLASALAAHGQRESVYFPEAGKWERRDPTGMGIDPVRLKEAIDHATASEAKTPRDLVLNHYQTFGREPFGHAIGPLKDRGPQAGVIVHKGYIVAEWGETARVDITNSVTKSMLSSVVGIAFDRGMIRSLDDPVRDYVPRATSRAAATSTTTCA
jgi:CubicO group peptidase (beta-lactamase class C family)